jgi:hypothetical protein
MRVVEREQGSFERDRLDHPCCGNEMYRLIFHANFQMHDLPV